MHEQSAQKVDPGEENSPAAPAGTRTRTFQSAVRRSTTEPSPLPNIDQKR